MELNSKTAIAFVRLVVGFAAGIAAIFGWTIDVDLWTSVGISIAALVILIYTWWWKNNNLTAAAQEMQKLLDEAKGKHVKE